MADNVKNDPTRQRLQQHPQAADPTKAQPGTSAASAGKSSQAKDVDSVDQPEAPHKAAFRRMLEEDHGKHVQGTAQVPHDLTVSESQKVSDFLKDHRRKA